MISNKLLKYIIQADKLYKLLIGNTVAEFRYHYHKMKTMHLNYGNLNADILKCPACPKICKITTNKI